MRRNWGINWGIKKYFGQDLLEKIRFEQRLEGGENRF